MDEQKLPKRHRVHIDWSELLIDVLMWTFIAMCAAGTVAIVVSIVWMIRAM